MAERALSDLLGHSIIHCSQSDAHRGIYASRCQNSKVGRRARNGRVWLHNPNTLLGAQRHLRVIVIGFAAAGINWARVLRNMENVELVCYENNPDTGGT